MLSNKKYQIVTDLLVRGRKLNNPLAFITQSFFAVPKNITVNSTHYLIMKIPNKKELQKIAINHSSDIDLKDLINLYKNVLQKPYYFLDNDTALATDNPLLFRHNLLERI